MTPARDTLLRAMTERQYQEQVQQWLEQGGFRYWHDQATNAPRRCGHCGHFLRLPRNESGMLDLIAVQPQRGLLLFLELKRAGKRPTPAQEAWLNDLARARSVVPLWSTPLDGDALRALLLDAPRVRAPQGGRA